MEYIRPAPADLQALKKESGYTDKQMAALACAGEQRRRRIRHQTVVASQKPAIEQSVMATQALLPTTADHNNKSVSAALANTVSLYLKLREDRPPPAITPGMPDLLMPLLACARDRQSRLDFIVRNQDGGPCLAIQAKSVRQIRYMYLRQRHFQLQESTSALATTPTELSRTGQALADTEELRSFDVLFAHNASM